MRAAPPPPFTRVPARRAATQRSDQGATAAVLKRAPVNTGKDATWLSSYNDWQTFARRYARTLGVVRFSAGILADTISRVTPRVEELDVATGEWVECEDPLMLGLFNEYRNEQQSPSELLRYHAWHYSVAGEMAQSVRDTPYGMSWGIHSLAAVEWDKPERGLATVKEIPDGKLGDETAFVVPREQMTRFWIPDEEWRAYASSPMAASIDDLHRWRSLARYARRTADSQLAMNGLVWFADDDWESVTADDEDAADDAIATPANPMEVMYRELAKLGFTEDDDITAIAPHLVHGAAQYGPPQSVEIGRQLDPNGIEHRREALEDYARGTNLPASLVVGGGPGDANHWTEWLVDDKFFDSAVAPTADRIFHMDLTATFLAPRLRIAGYDVRRYRMGYDPQPVIVKPDLSGTAHTLWLAGLLGSKAVREASNFSEDDAPTPEDLDLLFQVLTKTKAGAEPAPGAAPGVPAGPGDVVTGPPGNGEAPPPPAANGNTPPVPVAASAGPPTPAHVASVLARALLAFSEDQPRASNGQFGSGGDVATTKGDPDQMPPGSGTKEDPYRCTSASEAQQLIHDGKFVEMPSDQVSILLDKLAEISKEARAKGEKAPLYNLCQISVPDTNLFCEGNKGIDRIDMPQLAGFAIPGTPADKLPKNDKGETDITTALIAQLDKDGVSMDSVAVDANHLKATQNELNGAKVAGMMKSLEEGTLPPAAIFVSRDNYVVDGHHRWAANVGSEFVGGQPMYIPTIQVDMPIAELIPYVNEFASNLGMQQMAAAVR